MVLSVQHRTSSVREAVTLNMSNNDAQPTMLELGLGYFLYIIMRDFSN